MIWNQNSAKTIRIRSNNYSVMYWKLTDELIFIQRNTHYQKTQRDIDVLGKFAFFAIADLKPGDLSYRENNGMKALVGRTAVFIPPFGIVEWLFSRNRFSYKGLMINANLPETIPKEPIAFPVPDTKFPLSVEDVFKILRQRNKVKEIGKIEDSAVARRVKDLIDDSFSFNLKISDLASRSRLNKTVMSRFFKKSYGITPVEYRARLRVADAIRIMLFESESVAEAAFGVGFTETSRFYRQVRKHQKALPSKFRFRQSS